MSKEKKDSPNNIADVDLRQNRMNENEQGREEERKFGGYEIDLLEQAKLLWAGRKTILIITLVCALFGFFHYQFGPVDYESTARLIQESDTGGGGRGGADFLRSIAGIDVGVGSGVTATARGYSPPPLSLYPSIVHSTDFQKELIYREIEFETLDTTMTLYTYFTEFDHPPFRDQVYGFIGDYTIKLPFTILGGVRNAFRSLRSSDDEAEAEEVVVEEIDERLLSVTREELRVINEIRGRISLNIGAGITDVAVRLPDPRAAALVNAALLERIQEYMTEYREAKARQNLEYIEEFQAEARERYDEARLTLAEFDDSNIRITTNIARTQRDHLLYERDVAANMLGSFTQEAEQARITLHQQTPVFNVLEKPNIPTTSYIGASNVLLVFSIVLGFFLGIGWVLGRNAYHTYKQQRERGDIYSKKVNQRHRSQEPVHQ